MRDPATGVDRREVIKAALARVEQLQARLDAAEGARSEPIAVIGIGCRFPGGVDGPESYWRLLQDGVDAVREVPADRWDIDRYYDPDPRAPGKTYTRWGGYLDDIDKFDAQFFGIPPREAVTLDPQHRLFLEVVWEALENASLAPSGLRGSQTAVFVGVTSAEYLQHLNKVVKLEQMDAYHASGSTLNAAAGRVAYFLGLHGPAVSLDTACSSSLVALHLACQSLRNRECTLALAGGVNVILVPETYVCFSRWGMMSPEGRCKTFDASADGFVRAEGAGAVVLKRLADAVADGDNVLAVIRGSAVNQDGPSSGLSVPNGLAQAQVIRRALEAARVRPEQVGYVEAHGTGTTLGDPIEVEALGDVFGPGRPPESPLAIGSVKTNLGHMESAAGIAGLIKVVLALVHQEIPPHIHLKHLSPSIPWTRWPVVVPTERTPWRNGGQPRIGGVSSFGFSGTNAHVILEEAPSREAPAPQAQRSHDLLCLSAKSEPALRRLAERYAHHASGVSSPSWPDLCHTANVGRSHFAHRLAVVGSTSEEAVRTLSDFAAGAGPSGFIAGELGGTRRAKVAFLFTGQGAQYVGMGRSLYETAPVFREVLDRCDRFLRPDLDRPLLSVLYPDDGASSLLDETAYTQPALFALEYALAMLWRSWGLEPAVVLGHSVGEYVAACLSGVFSLEDGLKLMVARGRLMQALPRDGAMAAVSTDEGRVAAALVGREASVAVAAANGPNNVVISGRRDTVDEVLRELAPEGIRSHRLSVSHAFHSPLMDPMLDEFERVASQVAYGTPRLPLVSNVTGEMADAELMGQAAYWRRHVREPVRFADSIRQLYAQGFRVFVEVGPGATLLGMASSCVPEGEAVWLASLREGREDWKQLLESAGKLYVKGVELDWSALDRPYPRRRVPLPTYPFQRQRFWVDGPAAGESSGAAAQPPATGMLRMIQEGRTAELSRDLESIAGLSESETKLVPRVIDALVRRYRDETAAMSPPDWLYEVRWREKARVARPPANGAQGGDGWLLFADRGGVGEALKTQLEGRGQRCIVVRPGEGPARTEGEQWWLEPGRPAEYERLLEAMAEQHRGTLRGAIHLWSLDTVRPEASTLEALISAQRLGCHSVLHLARALARAPGDSRGKLWAVTRGAVPAEHAPRPGALAQAPVWGLGRALALERPEVRGGMVDLPADTVGDEAERLFAEVWDGQGEDEVALRAGRRYVPRLVRCAPPEGGGLRFDAEATYLITGGLGGLGLEVGRWMVGRGARHLVLVGRRAAATSEARAAVARFEQSGASVRVASADVASPEDMRRVFEEVLGSMPPLRGIMHAAGVAGYEALEDIDSENLEAVLRPKVAGTWVLHQLTRETRLDFFVCFSSIASVWGSKGQVHYAAANAFLDAFAHGLRGLGRPALSVNWGPWAGGGMATEEFRSYMTRLGAKAMSPERAVHALGRAMETERPQVVVADIGWSTFKAVFEARGPRPILEEIEAVAEQALRQPSGPPPFRQRLEDAPASQRSSLLVGHLQAEVAAVMGFDPADVPDLQRGFFDMGMDSLMAVELRDRLQRGLGCVLPATVAFDYPDVQALARHLLGSVLNVGPQASAREPSPDPAVAVGAELLQEIKGLSDENLEKLVTDELDALARE